MSFADETAVPIYLIVFWGIITFSFIVIVHELGHFLAAKAFKVRVHEFVIGLPGPMIRFTTRFVTVGITAIPFGGYVRVAGMEPGSVDDLLPVAFRILRSRREIDLASLAAELGEGIGKARELMTTLSDWGVSEESAIEGTDTHSYRYILEDEELEADSAYDVALAGTYRGKKTWQRIAILGTGVLFNLVLAIFVFTFVLSAVGYETQSTVIDGFVEGTPAEASALAAGDRIVEVDDTPVDTWEDVLIAFSSHEPGDLVKVSVDRGGESVSVEAILADMDGSAFFGVRTRLESVRVPVGSAFMMSLQWTGMVFEAMGSLFNPTAFKDTLQDARGVVGVSVEAARAAQRGAVDYAWIIALLSLSLGALNIFPIPPLDGGKIVLEVVEKVTGRPVKREIYLAFSAIGALLILSLLVYLVYADTIRYVFNG